MVLQTTLKEKAALEETVSALSGTVDESAAGDDTVATKASDEGGESAATGAEPGPSSSAQQSKISSLAKALKTLTEEKNSVEARFQVQAHTNAAYQRAGSPGASIAQR